MTLKTKLFTSLAPLFFLVYLAGCEEKSEKEIDSHNIITPKTMHPIENIGADTPARLIDLTSIAIALERYKIDNKSYPISSQGANEWDTLIDKKGNNNPHWIKGLTPLYLSVLPIDPRNTSDNNLQYAYKSNGAHYKLMALNPDDCLIVKNISPFRIDPMRDCTAYGYWTSGALYW